MPRITHSQFCILYDYFTSRFDHVCIWYLSCHFALQVSSIYLLLAVGTPPKYLLSKLLVLTTTQNTSMVSYSLILMGVVHLVLEVCALNHIVIRFLGMSMVPTFIFGLLYVYMILQQGTELQLKNENVAKISEV